MPVAASPSAAHDARRFVSSAASSWGHDDVAGDLELITTELVTNALLHGSPPVELRLARGDSVVRVEVADGSRARPVQGLARADAMTGRGLTLVGALSARWGADMAGAGKVVWAEVSTVGVAPTTSIVPGVSDATDADVEVEALLDAWDDVYDVPLHHVHLGDVPTDLLLAAKAHVDNLLREFALVTHSAEATGDIAAPLAALMDSVSRRFSRARESIKRQAIAAARSGAARTTLTLDLPADAAAAGEEYLAALDALDSYARAARLLTLESPPQHRVFRHWYVEELVGQLRRAAAGEPPAPPTSFEARLLAEVASLSAAHRSTERAARLQSVTAALARAATPSDVAAVVVSEGVSALGAVGGSLLIPEDDHLRVPGAVGYSADLLARLDAEPLDADLPAAVALRTAVPVWIESGDERDAQFPLLADLEPATLALCAVPLSSAGRVLGVLRFSFDAPRLFDADARRFTTALAAQTAQALDRTTLFVAERAAKERWVHLSEASQALSSSLEPAETLSRLTALLVPRLADWAVVHLYEPGAGPPQVGAMAHRDPAVVEALRGMVMAQPLDVDAPGGVGEVIRTRRSLRYSRVPDHVRDRAVAAAPRAELRAAIDPTTGIAVPLIARGRVLGALAIARTSGAAYTQDDLEFVEDLAARAGVAMLNAQQYQRERDVAVTLQRSLLPQTLPRLPGLRLAWRYLPGGTGSDIGGDWYDVIPIGDGTVGLVIGDVMGRGVQAAAVMGQLRATARAYATADLRPREVLERLDLAVGGLEQSQITTVLYGVLDLASGELVVASAGHLPPLVVPTAGEPHYLDVTPGPPLGTGSPSYDEHRVVLAPGTTLLLYTDGLVEDHERPVDVGLDLLRDAARAAAGPDDLCDRAVAELGRDNSADDVALLAVCLDGRPD